MGLLTWIRFHTRQHFFIATNKSRTQTDFAHVVQKYPIFVEKFSKSKKCINDQRDATFSWLMVPSRLAFSAAQRKWPVAKRNWKNILLLNVTNSCLHYNSLYTSLQSNPIHLGKCHYYKYQLISCANWKASFSNKKIIIKAARQTRT